jgi:hypothetical protein
MSAANGLILAGIVYLMWGEIGPSLRAAAEETLGPLGPLPILGCPSPFRTDGSVSNEMGPPWIARKNELRPFVSNY